MQLAHNDSFRAIDDKRALCRNQRHFAHEHGFLAHLFLILEPKGHMQRRGIRFALFQRFKRALLRRGNFIFHEIQQAFPIVTFDREHLFKYRLQANGLALCGRHIHLQKFVVRARLDLDQIR